MKLKNIFISLLIVLFFVGTSFGASVIVNPKFLALADGEPLSGGLVYTYSCGTTTPKSTYTTYTGGTANANPVVLSTQGEASIYSSGCLKVIIKTSAGVAVADGTIDNIYSFDSTIIQDADRDTKIQVEEAADEDIIRFDVGGTQMMYISSSGVFISGAIYNDGYGRVERSKFRWKDGDEIYMGAGAYHHSGTTEQLVYWNSEITFELEATADGGDNADSDVFDADGWHYIYLDDTAIVTQASALLDADCFLNETTAPTYSATKHGWYNGSDRCIFAVYETSDAILEFFHDGGELVIHAQQIQELASTDIDTTYTDVDIATSVPGFSTKAEINSYIEVKTSDASIYGLWRVNGATAANGYYFAGLERIATDQGGYFPNFTVILDSSQIFEVKMSRAGDDKLASNTVGWYFPNGM